MADQLLISADIEQAIIDELTPTFTIGTSIPSDKPAIFLRVIALGGAARDLVTDTPTVTLEAFALKESDARDTLAHVLARLQLAARKGHIGGETVYGLVVFALPQNYPLPSVPTHKRYITTIAPAIRRRVTSI
jgi:hypothetical protein